MAENDANTENQNLGNQGNSDNQDNGEPKTFTQAELDALLEKARKEGETSGFVKGKTETTSKFEKKLAEQTKLAKEEAEKQAKFEKMSDLQKAETRANDAESKLQALEDKIALNEQREETRKVMKDKGLPDSFLDAVLVFKDSEATLHKIDEFKALFDAEVQKAVESRIKVHVPSQNTEPNEGGFTEDMARKALKLK